MRVGACIGCKDFPCEDVQHDHYTAPDLEPDPQAVTTILISEAVPDNPNDYYYAEGTPSFAQTTLQAFNQAGIEVSSLSELLDMGVYFTTAVKCAKTGYGIKSETIKQCSLILEEEIALFPNLKAFLLMGDVAIKALNYVAGRAGVGRVVPVGSTYKIRGGDYRFRGARVFPSYLQVGPSFGIEKSKQRMIAEDIAAALLV